MSTNEELEALDAIRREISQAVPPGAWQGDRDWAVAACRLILDARRERDDARRLFHFVAKNTKAWEDKADALHAERDALVRELERWKAGGQIESDHLTEKDMEHLRVINERDEAREQRDLWAKHCNMASEREADMRARATTWLAERDAALSRVQDAHKRENELCRLNDEAHARIEALTAERDEALVMKGMGSELAARSTSTLKEIARLTTERDAAREESHQWSQKAIAQCAQANGERDAALAQVRELGGVISRERVLANRNIAQLEAEGAANARLRAAFERWQHTIISLTPEATTQHRVRLADELRAALAGGSGEKP